jgi:hypothetical protein
MICNFLLLLLYGHSPAFCVNKITTTTVYATSHHHSFAFNTLALIPLPQSALATMYGMLSRKEHMYLFDM